MTKIQQLAAITNPILSGNAGNDVAGAKSGSLFFEIIGGVLQFMMLLGAIIALINLLQSGIEWISGGGESSKLETVKARITNTILGLLILSGSFALWVIIRDFLGIEVTFKPLFP
jgi:hypothetical protein